MQSSSRIVVSVLVVAMCVLTACSSVDVTKTAKGSYDSTDANEIEILKTKPESREYFELGTVTATGFATSDVAKMHNAIRSKAAALGAEAVILTDEGVVRGGWGMERWAMGAAIRWGKPDFK